MLESELAQDLVCDYRNRIREVKRAHMLFHRYSDTALIMLGKQLFGQALCFLAEYEKDVLVRIIGISDIAVCMLCLGGISATEHVREILPVFAGISGSTSTM